MRMPVQVLYRYYCERAYQFALTIGLDFWYFELDVVSDKVGI